MGDLFVSIIMATRNAERFLPQALDSIAVQDHQNYELIVVDARSTDKTRTIAASYPRTTIVEQDGSGFAPAWNRGIESARGDAIAFLDSDDVWPKDSLARRVAQLAGDPDIDCVIGRVQFFLEEGHAVPPGFRPRLLKGSHVAYMPGVALLRRRAFHSLGQFEENWQIASDIVWFAKLRNSGAKIDVIDDILMHKRIHSSNLSNIAATMPVYRRELLALARQSVLGQRASHNPKKSHS
jgi:glycosyltransferase involved in cell wall biosynthesis